VKKHSDSASTPETDLPPNADYRLLDRSKLTPMLQHYVEVKEKYPHALLLYRVGDFFECFFLDAVTISRELELVLTSKEGGKEIGRVPMTGVPHHALDRHSTNIVEKGYPLVICDQAEDAATAAAERRMVTREVTQVLTPGTLTEEGMLSPRRNNFLAAVVIAGVNWGLAYADISTGEFLTTQGSNAEYLTQELMRLQPAEILVPTNMPDLTGMMVRPGESSQHLHECLPSTFCYAWRPQNVFSLASAKERLLDKFKVRALEGMGCNQLPLGVRAAGGLLEYLEETQKQSHVNLQLLRTYSTTDFLILDYQTRRNLEIVETVRDGSFHGSLLWAIDRTTTPMGGRALRRWLLQPLLKLKGIRSRQDTIQELVENTELRKNLRQLLRQVYDLERLTGRAGSGRANAKDLFALASSLDKLPELSALTANTYSPFLRTLQQVPPELEQLTQEIKTYLVEPPPQQLKEGGLIRPGVNEMLDEMREAAADDQKWLANLESQERQRTDIGNLKVGYNKTFGYYISIARAKADQVPDDYTRKQTLVNEERYITQELKEREARILTAREELNELEYDIFIRLRAEVGEKAPVIRNISRAVAAIDVLCSLAEIAVIQGYCRPTIGPRTAREIVESREIAIAEGRHPVVEQTLSANFFVPNSTTIGKELSNESPDLIILTGPNASGKSCYLRQVGLIQLMAQVGSFVPAESATLGLCDRIFTRVGAVDDLATGQSTFMVEMNETANILNHATAQSLVLLDEIGRGTATFDGLSIAWAVAEYLASEIKSRTIFATHYHELNELASILSNVANFQVTVKEMPNEIIFLHQVQPGGASKSYGIEAGRLAGLPPVVIQRAKQVMGQIEKHSKIAIGLREGIED